jgi:hypothetical protein
MDVRPRSRRRPDPDCPWKKPSMAFFHLGDTQKAKVFRFAGRRFLRRQT